VGGNDALLRELHILLGYREAVGGADPSPSPKQFTEDGDGNEGFGLGWCVSRALEAIHDRAVGLK
jgi:hypothetical protein